MNDKEASSVSRSTIDWNKLDDLPDNQLRLLLASAMSVLQRIADEEDTALVEEVAVVPPAPLTQELQALLIESGVKVNPAQAEQLTDSRLAMLLALKQIARQPELVRRVEGTFQERRRMLFVDPGTILAGAVLILVIKLKRVRADRGGVDIEFRDLKSDMLGAIRKFLGQ
jgi:hypothetical protein